MPERLDLEQRRRRRELLRRNHPDLGGDVQEFVRVLQDFQSVARRRAGSDEVSFVRRPRGLARVTAWYRRRRRRRSRPRRVT